MKERVKNVLNYKKPAFWVIVAAIVACAVVTVCFATNPTRSQEICIDGLLYVQSGDNISELPDGSSEIGTLKSVLHHTNEHPTEHLSSANLNEKYAGCPVYQSGTQEDVIYLEDFAGFYIPFVRNSQITDATPTQGPASTPVTLSVSNLDATDQSTIDELREKYPEYFELGTFKGLEVYVWQMAENDYRFGLMQGTNREKTPEEKMALKGTTAEEMALILSTFDIEDKDIFVIPWQHPASSYMVTEDMVKDPEYINNIRTMLGLDSVSMSPAGGEDTPTAVGPEMTIKKDTLKRTGATIIISDSNGKGKNLYGDFYRIDRKEGNEWKEVEAVNNDYVFYDIAYEVDESGKLELTCDWHYIYGELENGVYRLVKYTFPNLERPITKDDRLYFSAEFTIE